MEEKPSYYAIIPAEVRYDNDLRANEKLLYGEITALSKQTGECWASNNYFSELYNVKSNAIAVWIRHLKEKGYINIEYKYKGKEIQQRIIKIGGIQKDSTYYSKEYEGIHKKIPGGIQKDIENNINNNNTSNNNKKEINKERFGEFNNVLLSKEEYHKLEESNLLPYIEKLSSYIASKGKKYKSHYATILTWARKDKKDIKQGIIPEWFDKEIEEEEMSDETKYWIDYVNGKNKK